MDTLDNDSSTTGTRRYSKGINGLRCRKNIIINLRIINNVFRNYGSVVIVRNVIVSNARDIDSVSISSF